MKRRSKTRRSVVLFWLAGLLVTTLPAQNVSQGSNTTQAVAITENNRRPLATALDQLEKQILKPINFEEVPYQNPADIGRRLIHSIHGAKEFLFPVGGQLSATLDGGNTDAYSAAKTLIEAYNSSGLAGNYQVVNRSSHVDVLPVQVLASDGSLLSLEPVMEQELSFPVQTRTVLETLQLIVDALSQVAGKKVLLAGYPPMIGGTVEMGANNEPASDVLVGLYTRISAAPVSYRLLYDPNGQAYYLTLRGAPFNVGEPRKLPVSKTRPPAAASGNSQFFRKTN